jgi:enoyl-CoA hydratase
MTKEVLRHNVDAQSAAAAIALENRTQILAVQTGQLVEAMTAFVEKRPPRWD